MKISFSILLIAMTLEFAQAAQNEYIHWRASGGVAGVTTSDPKIDCFHHFDDRWEAEVYLGQFDRNFGWPQHTSMTFTNKNRLSRNGGFGHRNHQGFATGFQFDHPSYRVMLNVAEEDDLKGEVNIGVCRIVLDFDTFHRQDIFPGDSNLNGVFDSSDLVKVFVDGKYSTGEIAHSILNERFNSRFSGRKFRQCGHQHSKANRRS